MSLFRFQRGWLLLFGAFFLLSLIFVYLRHDPASNVVSSEITDRVSSATTESQEAARDLAAAKSPNTPPQIPVIVGGPAPHRRSANDSTSQPIQIAAVVPTPAAGQPGADEGDRYRSNVVLDERLTKDPKQPSIWRRTRLIKSDFKYPLLRVEDKVTVDPATGEQKVAEQKTMVADHIIVKLRKGTTEQELLAVMQPLGASIRRKMPASGIYLIEFPKAEIDTVPQAIASFAGPQFSVAEPDFIVHATVVPNDARFSELWGMNNTGQTSGTADADIDAPEAWDLAVNRGSHGILVGVIDTGIDASHPDLAPNIWTNPGEIASNGVDDDGNGFIDDVRGWDFVNNDNNPHDDNAHGTHCSGTIGGAGNNAAGVTGVCWNVSLVGLKFLNASGVGAISDAVEATAYGTLLGVDLTSNSWSGGGFSQAMKDEIDDADAAGILFVAAAGNASANNDTTANYPSNYASPNVIAVAATTHADELSSFSSYGATQVDLGAPGSGILSSVPGGAYASFNGTSMATPHVAGACALLKSYKPSLAHTTIRELILASTDPKPALAGKCASGGRLNIHQALILANDITVTPVDPFVATGPSGGPHSPTNRVYTLTNNADLPQNWTAGKTQPWLSLSATSGTLLPGASTTVTASLNAQTAALPDGSYADTITFTNATSSRSLLREVTLFTGQPDFFTEQFDTTAHDLDNQRFVFVPNASASGYSVTRAAAPGFNTDPTGGTTLSLTDDSVAQVTLNSGAQVRLYGLNYSTFYVGSNGYLTFGFSDIPYIESFAAHFSRARIAALFDDLLPNGASNISWRQLADRVAVTYEDISEYETTNANSFQIELFFDGRIAITHLTIAAIDGLIGLSRGLGTPANFVESDFSAYPVAQQFTVTMPATSVEGAGVLAGQGMVSVVPSPATDLTVDLLSSGPTEATVPASVVIPAGGSSAPFDITIVDDAVLDGTQTATIMASAPGYLAGASAIQVYDNETATLGLLLAATTTEGVASVSGTVTVDQAPVRAVVVTLVSSDITAAKVPLSVTIPAGQTSAPFQLTPEDDLFFDGPQTAVITAQVAGWTSGTATIVVEDNEVKVLTVSLPASVTEGATGVTGQVTIPGSLPINLTVALQSNDLSEISVPASVQINAGQMQANFPITVINDPIDDGSQVVTISATATGFASGSANVTVLDNDPHHFTISTVDGSQIRNGPFAVTITARRADGTTLPTFTGPATLTGAGAAGVVGVTPSTLTGFVGGVWTGNVTVTTADSAVVLTVTDGQNHHGSSNAFDVPAIGPLHHLTWAPVPGKVEPGAPFPVTILAKDRIDNTVTSFGGTVAISAVASAPGKTIGSGSSSTTSYPLSTNFHDQRTQIIYTAAELGGTTPLISLALELATLPGQIMNGFTIRLRHTTKTTFSGIGNATWETSGWTTVYQAAQTITTTGWNTFTFAAPFAYDGTSNLMVDISFDNASYTTSGAVRTTSAATSRVLYQGSYSNNGDPLMWSGSSPVPNTSTNVPNVRFDTSVPTPVTPSISGNFTAGVWNGSLAVLQQGTGVRLRGTEGSGATGWSGSFDVEHLPVVGCSPAGLSFVLPVGGSGFRPLTITNTGSGALTWSLSTAVDGTVNSVAGGPVFTSTAAAITDKAKDILAPADAHLFAPTRTLFADDDQPSASAGSLSSILDDINASYTSITALIQNRYNFSGGDSGTSIDDGGGDMYDIGNILSTNLGFGLSYTNGVISNSTALGAGGQYFTRKYPGLFVFAADVSGLSYFEITGNLGADGGGLTDTAVFTVIRGGVTYKGFTKRVHNTSDPSVNHLIIVADNGTVNHTASTDTNNDQHRITGLSGATRLYYLLYARDSGGYVDNAATLGIMNAFLKTIGDADWATFSPGSGNILPGGSQTVNVTAYAQSLAVGTYPRTLIISSNDPFTPQLIVPVTLAVVPAGDSDSDLLPDFWEMRQGWIAGDGQMTHGGDWDYDQDGASNWLEYLLDLNPLVADASQMPAQSTAINPDDGLRYLTFTYRRRTDIAGYDYSVQISTDMIEWNSGSEETEEILVTPNVGGESETVVVRVKPALGTPGLTQKFMSLKISAPSSN